MWQEFQIHMKTHNYLWKWKAYFVLPFVVLLIIIDQITKQLALKYANSADSWLWVKKNIDAGHKLFFAKTFNPGVAFGFGGNLPLSVIIIIPLIVVLIVLFSILYTNQKNILFPIGMILAGGFSNILDRIWHKKGVVDFIYWNFSKPNTIFNIADVFVISGVILFVLILIIDLIMTIFIESKKNKVNNKIKKLAVDDQSQNIKVKKIVKHKQDGGLSKKHEKKVVYNDKSND